MTTAAYEKLKREVKKELFDELSGFILRESKDAEGEYRPEFVKKMLHTASRKKKLFSYDRKNFLKIIS